MSDFRNEKGFKQETPTVADAMSEFLGVPVPEAKDLLNKLNQTESTMKYPENDNDGR